MKSNFIYSSKYLQFIRLRSKIFYYVADSDLKLISDGLNPWIVVHPDDRLVTSEIQVAYNIAEKLLMG